MDGMRKGETGHTAQTSFPPKQKTRPLLEVPIQTTRLLQMKIIEKRRGLLVLDEPTPFSGE